MALAQRSALKTRLREAHFGRDMGTLIYMDNAFRVRGVPSHRQRTIMLDTIVRTFIADPLIEVFADESLRYHISPKSSAVLGVVKYDLALRRFCVNHRGDWLCLLSPLCENCLRSHVEHANNKCLFEPTSWVEHVPDDEPHLREDY